MQNGGSLYLLQTFATTPVLLGAGGGASASHSYLCNCCASSFSMRSFSSASALASRAIARKGAFCSCVMPLHSLAMILAISAISICKRRGDDTRAKRGEVAEEQTEWEWVERRRARGGGGGG